MNGTSRLRNYDDFLRIIEIRRAAELLFEDVGQGRGWGANERVEENGGERERGIS